ncbi:MAG TPA: CAP domain-containing protein, partial [Hyphomicrobiales bacterium]
RGWQNSPDHNANLLLPDAQEMGIAMVHDSKTQFKTFWTLVLSSPVSVQ